MTAPLGRKPGLGIELDRAAVERLRVPDPLAMPDGLYSDMVFGKEFFAPLHPYRELE